ncbi:MAG: hypothetical protein JO280_13540 [Mycobacteriaceae bacterium]|nr:hypothetical protein [Mycobacteriaceae bacterium]
MTVADVITYVRAGHQVGYVRGRFRILQKFGEKHSQRADFGSGRHQRGV